MQRLSENRNSTKLLTMEQRVSGRVAIFIVFALSAIGSARQTTPPQVHDLKGLNGEWVYVEDRTEDRPLEQQGPPMSGKFSFLVEDGAVILVNGHGSGHRNVRVSLDGTVNEVMGTDTVTRYRGAWKDGVFWYETESQRGPEQSTGRPIRKEFRVTTEGLAVRVTIGSPAIAESTALYRHPEDIEMPTPAKAMIGDLSWLSGAWVGTRGTGGTTSIEERWGSPLGGAMLAVSRTVSREKMTAFEYLRIVERDGGLVYIAQPNGAAPTEFVLAELGEKRAVFVNPRHDYPKRIVYELSSEGALTASIGLMKGGTPRRFEYKREGS